MAKSYLRAAPPSRPHAQQAHASSSSLNWGSGRGPPAPGLVPSVQVKKKRAEARIESSPGFVLTVDQAGGKGRATAAAARPRARAHFLGEAARQLPSAARPGIVLPGAKPGKATALSTAVLSSALQGAARAGHRDTSHKARGNGAPALWHSLPFGRPLQASDPGPCHWAGRGGEESIRPKLSSGGSRRGADTQQWREG